MTKLDFPEGALRPIGEEQMDAARHLAEQAPRKRALLRYHEHEEAVQRMVHAVEPDSYVCPHKHESPDKVEAFLILAGRVTICRFDDDGELVEQVELSASGPVRGVEIPPRSWHSMVSHESGSVVFELVEGAYDPNSHKLFAPFAPEEGSREALEYLTQLKKRLAS